MGEKMKEIIQAMISNMKRNVVRVLLVLFALLLAPGWYDSGTVEAAAVTYRIDRSNGTNIVAGIITTNVGTCGNNTGFNYITIMMTGTQSCSSFNLPRSNGTGTALEAYFNTAYASNTNVTGTSLTLRLRDASSGGFTAGFQLFYVNSAGTKTNFNGAQVTQNVPSGSSNDYPINLSSQSATVPSGSKLGIRISISASSTSDARVYLGSLANAAGNGPSGVLIVDESAATPPSEVSGTLAVNPVYGVYTAGTFTITENFNGNGSAVTSCQYTINGTTWNVATVTGTGPYTCTASNVSAANGTALTIQMRATNSAGTSTPSATLNYTVDSAGPTDGTLTVTPASGQNTLSWTAASDSGSGLAASNTYKIVFNQSATPPADCNSGTSLGYRASPYTHTGLTNGLIYSYRVCAYDNLGNVSTGATGSGTPGVPSPSVVSGPTASSTQYNTFVDSPFTLTSVFNDNGVAISSCAYSLNNGSTWTGATLSGSGASTQCQTTTAACSNGTSLTILMRATNAGGTTTTTSLARTCDTAGPVDGTLTATTVGSSQIDLSWTAATDSGSGLATANTYKLVRASGATPPADCSGAAIYQGTGLAFNDTGLNASTQYSYRVCAYDNLSYVSAGATATATTQAQCSLIAPTVVISPSSKLIVTDGESADYSVSVANNDTGAGCADTMFTFAPTDSNGTAFNVSIVGLNPVTLAPGANTSVTLTVHAKAGQMTGTNDTFVTATASGHANSVSNTVTTTLNVGAGIGPGDGNLLKRSAEDMCQGCHKTDRNPATRTDPNSIKMHSAEWLGTCSNAIYKNRTDCLANGGSWASKWGPSGWGIAGGKYGEFSCTTCHTAHDTKNIYLINETVKAPNSPTDNFPGSVVDFRIKSGTAGVTVGTMGDDSAAHGTSTKVCEVCHSQNTYHNYNSSFNANNMHNNALDCSTCHSHKLAFKGACDACHNAPPATGKHATHFGNANVNYGTTTVQSTSGSYGFSCGICHNGTHLNTASNPRTVEVSFAGMATQDGAAGAGYAAGSFSVDNPGKGFTFNYSDGSCSNVYCHGNYPGSGKNASLSFNTGTAVCGSCHGASNWKLGSNPPNEIPNSGSHDMHASTDHYNLACTLCHKDIVAGAGYAIYTIVDKSTHVSGYIDWKFNISDSRVSASSSYSIATGTQMPSNGTTRAYGTCSNIYCHSIVQSSNGGPLTPNTSDYKTPQWGNGGSVGCGDCHPAGGNGQHPTPHDSTVPYSGSHTKHLQYSFGVLYRCALCHGNNGASANFCIGCHIDGMYPSTFHVDGNVLVGFAPQASGPAGSYSGTPAPGDGYGSCSNTYCHSNGTSVSTGTVPNNTSPNWGTAGPLPCSSCHSNPPAYANGSPKANSHLIHTSTMGYSCDKCHYTTTNNGTTIASTTTHVNKAYDVNPNSGAGISFTYTFNAAGGTCNTISCHGNTAAQWGGTACLGCHSVSQGSRAAITSQFSANSHHVQGVTMTDQQCYQCHWEANADGSINTTYHGGPAVPGSPVNLVVYGAGSRPTTYTLGTTAVAYTANGSRTELQKINQVCLGCHDDDTATAQPFGDGKTPKQYAWDGTSVGARYSQPGTTTWGKYTTFTNAAQKNVTKAYSAHGNVNVNQRGWNTTTGVDGAITDAKTGTQANVLCFDCHNSHGSTVSGTTTSYASTTTNGGVLKDTTASKGGYAMTYKPQTSDGTGSRVAHNAGAGLCFDCHMTANAGTTPWGYSSTFAATQMIIGYLEKPGWKGAAGTNPSGAQQRYSYKNNRGSTGGHFGASSSLGSSVMGTIDGLCTPCHDPHGVSPTDVGYCSNASYATKTTCVSNGGTWTPSPQYGVPLLKGTWVTSPYKEDVAPANTNENRGGGTGRSSPSPIQVGSTPGYHIDQNTFRTQTTSIPTWNLYNLTGTGTDKVTQTASQFGGLCLQCHPQSSINPDGGTGNKNTTWTGYDRIHNTVQGWGGQGANVNNAIHGYTCSKCHTPHNACLPRLMITNCLDFNHRGRIASGGTVRSGTNAYTGRQSGSGSRGSGRGNGRYPGGGGGYGDQPNDWNSGGGAYFFGIAGTSSSSYPAFRSCHDTPNGGTWPNNQQWNSKTPW